MENFIYHNPTKIIFGKDTERQAAEIVKEYANRVLLHYGGTNIQKHGIYASVTDSLKKEGIDFIELSGVKPNPVLERVHQGIDLCRKEKIDFILAVGGGSVIDSAKAIAIGTPYKGDVWDFFEGKASPKKALSTGSVLTIPGAGSESSDAIVITNEEGLIKKGYHSECVKPKFAILNPELTYTLSHYQTASGVSDMMSHVMERYFTHTKDVELTDRLCESTLKTMIGNAPIAIKEPKDYNARAQLMWAATIAHSGILGTGRSEDWGSHKIGHELGAIYDIAHGASLSIILPAWLRYAYKKNIPRAAQFASRVFDVEIDFNDMERTALEGIKKLSSFYKSIGLPSTLSEAGIGEDRFEEMAQKCTLSGPKGNFIKMGKEDVFNILNIAK